MPQAHHSAEADSHGDKSLAAVAHQLRNVLSPMASAAQLLSVQPENAAQVRELASVILHQIEQLKRLIDDLHAASQLGASRIGADNTDLRREPGSPEDTRATATADLPLPKLRVLVVDDTPAAAHLLRRLLEKLNQEVRVADSADAALEALRQFEACLVISDIAMPGASGHELARKIRSLRAVRQPRLVALTGYGQASDRDQALAAGFDDYLSKPVELSALKLILASLVPQP